MGYSPPPWMITSKSYLTLIYFVRIILFLNYTRPFIFWVMTELNLILFIFMIVRIDGLKYKQEIHDLIIFYFIIQSIASILILRDFFFSREFFIFNSEMIFICAILIKLGIFPFFFWIFKVSQFLNKKALCILLTLQKVPFFFVLFNSFNFSLSFILFFSFISGSVLIFYRLDIIFLIVASSVASRYWIFYLYSYSFFFFIFYFSLYSIFLFSFFYRIEYNFLNSLNSLFFIFLFTFLLGLSPISLFFFKFYTMFFFLINYKVLEIVSFWILRFLCLFGYRKFFFKSFFFNFEIYSSVFYFYLKNFFFSFSILIFFFFLVY